jgi:hypothetical protein
MLVVMVSVMILITMLNPGMDLINRSHLIQAYFGERSSLKVCCMIALSGNKRLGSRDDYHIGYLGTRGFH